MNEPQLVNLTTTFDLNKVRPKNPDLCSEEQFALFCKAFHEVQASQDDPMPLHIAIREVLTYHSEMGKYSLENVIEDLTSVLVSAHRLTDNQLAKGKLSYEWVPLIIQHEEKRDILRFFDPPLIGLFTRACHNFNWNTPVFLIGPDGLEYLMNLPNGRERMKCLQEIVEAIMKTGAEALTGKKEECPEVMIEIVNFPRLHLKFGCKILKHEEARFMFRIYENKDKNTFTIELEWDSGTDKLLPEFELPHLINDANRSDEDMVIDSETTKPVYRLNIDPLGRAVA